MVQKDVHIKGVYQSLFL